MVKLSCRSASPVVFFGLWFSPAGVADIVTQLPMPKSPGRRGLTESATSVEFRATSQILNLAQLAANFKGRLVGLEPLFSCVRPVLGRSVIAVGYSCLTREFECKRKRKRGKERESWALESKPPSSSDCPSNHNPQQTHGRGNADKAVVTRQVPRLPRERKRCRCAEQPRQNTSTALRQAHVGQG